MPDTFTETAGESWFGRIGGAIKGVAAGFILFVVAFPVLFWNEGASVKRYRTLKEGLGAVVSVKADAVNPANEGRLVHMTGDATTAETPADPLFKVSAAAIRLERDVEMYQWREDSSKTTEKKLGGGSTTTTTYEYRKVWYPGVIASSTFRQPEGHQNPAAMPFESGKWQAGKVAVGAFALPPAMVSMVGGAVPLAIVPDRLALPEGVRAKARPLPDGFYAGADPDNPAVGDLRVTFRAVTPPHAVSLVARQAGNTFEPYPAKAGGSIRLLKDGTFGADTMFQMEQDRNTLRTWIFRLIGFLMMLAGAAMVIKPLSVLADVLPFLGDVVAAGTGLIAFVVAAGCASCTIAAAWLFHRPLAGIPLLAGAGFLAWIAARKIKARRAAKAAPAQA